MGGVRQHPSVRLRAESVVGTSVSQTVLESSGTAPVFVVRLHSGAAVDLRRYQQTACRESIDARTRKGVCRTILATELCEERASAKRRRGRGTTSRSAC